MSEEHQGGEVTRKEKILVRKAVRELDKISGQIRSILEEEDGMEDLLYAIDQSQSNAREALLVLPGMKT